jgi:hypothetical protein
MSGIRTIAVTWNNWIKKYLNSSFGEYPGRLPDLSFGAAMDGIVALSGTAILLLSFMGFMCPN